MVVIITLARNLGGEGWWERNIWYNLKNLKDRHASGHDRCIIIIKNQDQLCTARAIVTAIAHHNKDTDSKWNSIHQGLGEQTVRVRELMEKVGLQQYKGPVGVDELAKLQEMVPDYQIKVFTKEISFRLLYQGAKAKKAIYLLLENNNYSVCTSMPAFKNASYWCDGCNKAYYHREDHHCSQICQLCHARMPCEVTVKRVYCKDCNQSMRSQECYENHKQKPAPEMLKMANGKRKKVQGRSVCEKIWKCDV